MDAIADVPLDQRVPLRPGQQFRLRLDIGPLDPASHVTASAPIPELPRDVWIDVALSSNDFQVGARRADLGHSQVALGKLFLPGDGAAATTDTGERYLLFHLAAPDSPRIAQGRVTYYYRNVIVQSQRLEAEVAIGSATRRPAFDLITDYTVSERLTDLAGVPEGRGVSVVAGDYADGRYRFVVRGAGSSAAGDRVQPFELNEATVGQIVKNIRDVLRERAPTTQRRSRRDLETDLRQLAPLGWRLYNALPGQCSDLFEDHVRDPEHSVIQVCRPNTASFTLPWTLVYEIPMTDRAVQTGKLTLCPVVGNWKEGSLVPQGTGRTCPAAGAKGHAEDEDILCPFGFWGYRYTIEQLAAARTPERSITPPPRFALVTGETRYEVSQRELDSHVERLLGILRARYPGVTLERGASTRDLRRLLGTDVPIVYFFCHGERPRPGHPDTVLAVGERETLSVSDFTTWVIGWRRRSGRRLWDTVRPLVLINACHSVEVNPETLASYVDAFIGRANAAGVIGTEVRVEQKLAMAFAEEFLGHFAAGRSLDVAMRAARLGFLSDGNLLGLCYSAYAWSDLTLKAASAEPSEA